MKRGGWFITSGIAILVLVVGFFVLSQNHSSDSFQDKLSPEEQQKINEKGESPKEFTSAMTKRAEDAFSKGILIEDPENDWYLPPEGTMQWDKPDNPKPYPFPFTDLKSVSLGADEQYLYVKFIYYGDFPTEMPSYNGDDLFSTGAKIDEMRYLRNGSTLDSAEMGAGVGYIQPIGEDKMESYEPLDKPSIGQLAMISPQGTDERGETIYQNKNGEGFVSGGAGHDYLLSAFPLSEFGISYGDEVNLSLATETGSNKWHHESIDLILNENNSKSGSKIQWKLGSSEYKIHSPTF